MSFRQLPIVLVLALAAVAASSCSTGVTRDQRTTNVLLITVDTLRADHVSCYGYPRKSTPNADSLAANGTRFENAIVQIPETLPSVFSIMTSSYPVDHGVRANGYEFQGARRTLAQILEAEGYVTVAFVSSIVLRSKSGIDRGFETYDESFPDTFLFIQAGQRTAEKTTQAVVKWLEANSRKERPFFLWVHYIDPHSRYMPPSPFDDAFRERPYQGKVTWDVRQFFGIIRNEVRLNGEDVRYLTDRYDGEIAFTDHSLGMLLEKIDDLGLEDTLIVFTADHGESLGEHDYFFDHGDYVYDDQIRVPLILRHPRILKGKVIRQQVQSVDIMPTILDFLDIQVDDGLRGRSLVPLMAGKEQSPQERFAFSESDNCRPRSVRKCSPLGIDGKIYSLRRERWKYILNPGGPNELYDLIEDPSESTNRITERPEIVTHLEGRLTSLIAGGGGEEQTLDQETIEQLRSLGYLN